MPADCDQDFEWSSSSQSPAIASIQTLNMQRCRWRSVQMIVQESARGMTQCLGSEKVPTTPITSTAVRQDLDQENVHRLRQRFSESQQFLAA